VRPGLALGPVARTGHFHTANEVARLLQLAGRGTSLRRSSLTVRLESHHDVEDHHGMRRASRAFALAARYLDLFAPRIDERLAPKRWPRILVLDSTPLNIRAYDAELHVPGWDPEDRGGAILAATGSGDPGLPMLAWRIGVAGDETTDSWLDFLSGFDPDGRLGHASGRRGTKRVTPAGGASMSGPGPAARQACPGRGGRGRLPEGAAGRPAAPPVPERALARQAGRDRDGSQPRSLADQAPMSQRTRLVPVASSRRLIADSAVGCASRQARAWEMSTTRITPALTSSRPIRSPVRTGIARSAAHLRHSVRRGTSYVVRAAARRPRTGRVTIRACSYRYPTRSSARSTSGATSPGGWASR
jgi:hypothetical protein